MWILLLGALSCFVYNCNGVSVPVQELPVGSKENPGESCMDIQKRGGTNTGNYYITLGQKTLLVYCDQETAGGGWTLVYSYTFTNFNHKQKQFSLASALIPRPNWKSGNTPISTTPPTSETDYNAMDFKLWKEIGREFMIKSNMNNWISCLEGSGSLVYWIDGSVKCKLVKNYSGMCPNVVPNFLTMIFPDEKGGPCLYASNPADPNSIKHSSYYCFSSSTDSTLPTHDPCGTDSALVFLHPRNPRGNIFIR